MRVEWVTFDCYGTLIDWERGITDALLPLLPPGVDRPEPPERPDEPPARLDLPPGVEPNGG